MGSKNNPEKKLKQNSGNKLVNNKPGFFIASPSSQKPFFVKVKSYFSTFIKNQITQVEKTGHYSFKRFRFFIVLSVILISIILFELLTSYVASHHKINQNLVINVASSQMSAVVAGQPVRWFAIVKRSNINSKKYLLQLPRGAKNVAVQIISLVEKENMLALSHRQGLFLSPRVQLAESTARPLFDISAQPVDSQVSNPVDTITEIGNNIAQIVEANSGNPTVTPTSDSTIVDLSSQVLPSAQISSENSNDQSPVLNGNQPSAPGYSPTQNQTVISQSTNVTALTADIAAAKILISGASIGTGSGDYVQADVDILQSAISSAGSVLNSTTSVQSDIDAADSNLNAAVSTFKASNQYVAINYTTPAPVITSQATDTGKLVTISAVGENPDCGSNGGNETQLATPAGVATAANSNDLSSNDTSASTVSPAGTCLTNVLASTTIPPIFKVGEESKIHIKWKNNSNKDVAFHAYDTDGDGYLDYVEWTVPHLSDQEFEIIFISKDFQLDNNQNIVADIYPQTQTKDNVFAAVPATNYARVTFNQTLDNTKDITIYTKATDPSTPVSINVYPVYTDDQGNQTEGDQLQLVNDGQNSNFTNITTYQKYRVLLKNLQTSTDMFDLQIIGGSIDIDYVVDPATYTILGSFSSSTNGSCPYYGSLIISSNGSTLYGMTETGGAHGYGDGTIFSIPSGGGTITDLYDFTGSTTDGAHPYGSLLLLGSTLYGMTHDGGLNGKGIIFSIPTTGGTGNLVDMHDFGSGSDGANPYGSLIILGNTLYGMTHGGGTGGKGMIFSITTGGSYNDLHDFTGSITDGANPYGSLTLSSDASKLYGMTSAGGNGHYSANQGIVFSIPVGGGALTDIYDFDASAYAPGNARVPYGSLVLSGDGNTLYGMTENGGYNYGAVFSITTSGSYTELYDFLNYASPYGSVNFLGDRLYGMTYYGSNNNLQNTGYGMLFSFPIIGGNNDYHNFTGMHDFVATGGDGEYPYGSAVLSSDGNTFYGMTCSGGLNSAGMIFSYVGHFPNTPSLVSPTNNAYTNSNEPTLSANFSDPVTGVTGTTNYEITNTFFPYSVIASGTSSTTSSNNQNTTWTPGSPVSSGGTYNWLAQNNNGTYASLWTSMGSFTIDTTNPTSTISSPSNNSYSNSSTVPLSGTSSDAHLSTTTISVDSGSYVATSGSAASWTYSATGLSNGAHTFQTKATDLALNTGLSSLKTVTVDTVAPVITVTAFPTVNNTNQSSVGLSGVCEGSLAITLSVADTHSHTVTASPAPTCSSGTWSKTLDLSTLNDGDIITATISQTDAAGNTGTGTKTSIKDTVVPTTTAAGNSSSYTFGNASSVDVTVTLSCLDSVGGSGCFTTLYCIDQNAFNSLHSKYLIQCNSSCSIFNRWRMVYQIFFNRCGWQSRISRKSNN